MTRVVRYPDPHLFSTYAVPFLAQQEPVNNLPLGLLTNLRLKPNMYGSQPYYALVDMGGRTAAAALMTPPYGLILAHADEPDVLQPLAEDVLDFRPDTPGVNGLAALSLRFAQIWQQLTGRGFRRRMAERIYQLTRVNPPRSVPGQLRRAGPDDRGLLLAWMHAFQAEAFGEADPAAVERSIDNALTMPAEARGLVVWEVAGRPVSLAGYGGQTPSGIRIGPVYTPPDLRGRGYASACVAGLSQQMLDSGRRFCFLYTDLANPTSNRIYQAIGYEPVGDVDEYAFDTA